MRVSDPGLHSIRRSHFCSFHTLSTFDGRILAAFALSPHSRALPFSRTIAFSHLSLTLSIRRSHFGSFCSLSAFDGRILAALPLSAFAHAAPAPPFSRTIAFLPLSHSPHSTVAFWQVLLNLSIPRSHFGSFSSLRILTRRPCPPFSRTIAFLQPSLTPNIQRLRFGNFCSISAFDGHILAAFSHSAFSHAAPAPVLAYDRILAAFAHSQHSTVAFWRLLLNLSIRRSHFGSVSSLRILPWRPWPLFSHTIMFLQLSLTHSIRWADRHPSYNTHPTKSLV